MDFIKLFLISYLICAISIANDCKVVFGAVPQYSQEQIFATWTPILDRLSKTTECTFELQGSKNISQFEENFSKGLYDLAYMNPYHFIVARKQQGYEALIRSGAKKLKGILVVHKNSSTNINDIQDKTLAFPSPNALGASLLMRAELMDKEKLNFKVNYVKTHTSVYLHVAKGLAYAGGGVLRTFNQSPKNLKEKLKIIYETTSVSAHPIVIHPRLNDKKEMILLTLLNIAKKSPELFEKIPMRKPIKATYEDYKILNKMDLEKFSLKREQSE